MQVSQKQETFFEFFSAFLRSRFSFEHFQKKDDSHNCGIFDIIDSGKHGCINV